MTEPTLTSREIRRYTRQIMLPDIGLAGQEKIKNAKVLVIGAGGLGCPVLQYLAAAGVGRITIAEFDRVDETNLQRQVLYGSGDVGKLKSIVASSRLEQLNDLIVTEKRNLRVESSNALRIIKNHDIVVDATDNFSTRYIINDACIIMNRPMVHGAIYMYEGQVSVFNYKDGPTYRCFNPLNADSDYKNPQAGDTGLFGVLPGITGSIMANEVLKIITGTGEVLSGRVLIFNISDYSFRILKVKNIPENHNIRNL